MAATAPARLSRQDTLLTFTAVLRGGESVVVCCVLVTVGLARQLVVLHFCNGRGDNAEEEVMFCVCYPPLCAPELRAGVQCVDQKTGACDSPRLCAAGAPLTAAAQTACTMCPTWGQLQSTRSKTKSGRRQKGTGRQAKAKERQPPHDACIQTHTSPLVETHNAALSQSTYTTVPPTPTQLTCHGAVLWL